MHHVPSIDSSNYRPISQLAPYPSYASYKLHTVLWKEKEKQQRQFSVQRHPQMYNSTVMQALVMTQFVMVVISSDVAQPANANRAKLAGRLSATGDRHSSSSLSGTIMSSLPL